MKSNTLIGKEAKDAFDRGFNLVADVVVKTLGAAGSNGMVESILKPGYELTNDGSTLANGIEVFDPFERIGAKAAKDITNQADIESHDGTTTALTLARAIIKEGRESDASPMRIKNGLDDCLPIIYKYIDDKTIDVDVDSISQVVSTSAESRELGDLIQEIYQKIGKTGLIELDNSNTPETYYTIREGVRLRNCGYMAPYMANEGKKAVIKNPKILITQQKINTVQDIDPLFQMLEKEGVSEVVIFCEDLAVEVYGALAFTHKKGIFKTLIIKSPKLWKDWIFEDFAKITGATIISPESGLTLKTVELKHLGTCGKIITSQDDTTILGIQDISDHIAQLEQEALENDQIKNRIAWLNTKVAVLKIGGISEADLTYRKKKAEDAVGTAYLALKGGIVAGGGITLHDISDRLPDTVGGRILKKALKEPLRQIATNYKGGSFDLDFIYPNGLDARTGMTENMLEAGILDAALVCKNSVKSAIGTAGAALTVESLSHLLDEPKNHEKML